MRYLAPFPHGCGPAGLLRRADFPDGWLLPLSNRWFATDVQETGTEYRLTMDLPGLDKGDVQLQVKDNVLQVVAERNDETSEGSEDSYLYRERHYGRQERSFLLPADADPERITATFDKGQLTIAVPKREGASPRRIDVQ